MILILRNCRTVEIYTPFPPKVNSAFVRAVRQGAENILDGFVEPVNGNPEDPAFLWGGLFMSQGAAVALFGSERGRR